jgi:formylglycine-generating enzyme required for sulfatase activity
VLALGMTLPTPQSETTKLQDAPILQRAESAAQPLGVRAGVRPQLWAPVGTGPRVLTLARGVKMVLVEVPAGSFLMGRDPKRDPQARRDEQLQRSVHLDGNWMGKTPVTNVQYAAFVAASGRKVLNAEC